MNTNTNRRCSPVQGELLHIRASGLRPLALCLATLTAIQAHAASSPADRNFNQRIYVGANAGLTHLQPRTDNTPYEVNDNSSTGGSLTLGYDLTPHWSIEGYFANLGKASIRRKLNHANVGDIDYRDWGVSAIGYFYNSRRAADYVRGFDDEGFYRREGLSAYGRVGFSRLETTSGSVDFEQINDTDIHIGAGLEYGWSNGIAARAELVSYDKDSKFLSIGILKRFGEAQPYPLPKVEPAPKPVAKPAPLPVEPPPAAPEPPAPPPKLPTVLFDFDHSDLNGVARAILDSFVADILQPDPRLRIRITGHTDSIGTEAYNMGLSIRRAESVKRYLESKGIAKNRLETLGLGESQPLNDNATAAKRALNRRVEFELLK